MFAATARRRIFAALALTCLSAPLLAQATGRLAGRVEDDSGAPLPGVTLTASSPNLMGTRTTQSDPEGSYAFPSLPPGTYALKAELEGFVPQENNAVEVRLGRTAEINFRLPLGEFTEEVMVVAETPVIDPEQVSTSQTFGQEYLKKSSVSSLNRGYQNVLSNAAGVAGGANPNVFGSTLGENAYYIDGIDSTDPVTATFGINLNFDTIQEINFETGGFEAEFGRATGGVVDVITKSGGNRFSGTFDVRYRDTGFNTKGDHFDPDDNETEFQEPSATLGGPIVRDKVWFFAAADQVNSEATPTAAPTTRDFEGLNLMGKVTWQIAPEWNSVVRYLDEDTTIDNVNSDRDVAPEATYQQEQPAQIYSAEVFGVPSGNLALTVAVAAVRNELNAFPQSGDFDTIGHSDDFGDGSRSVNYTNIQRSQRDRDELQGSLSWFVEDRAGDHEFKVGLENARLDFTTENFTSGRATINGQEFAGLRYADSFGEPFVLWYEPNAGAIENEGTLYTGYLQDTWRVSQNLTVKLGVRYDTVAFDNDAGEEVADLDKLQPRVGFAYDLKGDGRSVVRGSWGRFMHPSALTLPNFARVNSRPAFAYLSCGLIGLPAPLCEAFFSGELTAGGLTVPTWIPDPEGVFEPNGWVLFDGNVFSSAPSTIANDLEATYADELVLGFEQELTRRTSIGVSYINKSTKDIFEDTCNGNLAGPAADAACDFYVMANLPGLQRDYEGVVVDFESRFADWIHLLASYTYSKSEGNVEYTQNAGTDFDIFPDHFQNRYGYLSDHAKHRMKVNGYVDLPLDFTIGFDATYSSPYTYEAREAGSVYGETFLESRGSREANSVYRLDLQVAKGFQLGAVRLEAIGSVLNALDDEQVLSVCDRIEGCGDVPLDGDLTYRQPRFYEVGLRLEW